MDQFSSVLVTNRSLSRCQGVMGFVAYGIGCSENWSGLGEVLNWAFRGRGVFCSFVNSFLFDQRECDH